MLRVEVKEKATALREQGYSLSEISQQLSISQSTASLWLRGIKLSEKARGRIDSLSVSGRKKAVETNRKKRAVEDIEIAEKVERYFLGQQKIDSKIACALLYWGEGTKYSGNKSVSFMNADPEMIGYFLRAFRNSFSLDEKRLRALIHLHEYHDADKQLKFWSNITKIPTSQFNKSYLKKNTGKSEKENYPGCISIRYSDNKVYKELMLIIGKLAKI
ncbi:MAG: hypothetical protein WAV46_02785 [Candidatus Moraniibacteriota bacterium]